MRHDYWALNDPAQVTRGTSQARFPFGKSRTSWFGLVVTPINAQKSHDGFIIDRYVQVLDGYLIRKESEVQDGSIPIGWIWD